MFTDLGISEADWNSTPQSVKTALIALQHQARLMELRFTAYEKKLAALEAKEAEIESLKTEAAALRERLGQNSSNSSRPPSSDPPPAVHRAVSRAAKSRARRSGIREPDARSSRWKKLTTWLSCAPSGVAGAGVVCRAMIHNPHAIK
jgi:hypothetical protein